MSILWQRLYQKWKMAQREATRKKAEMTATTFLMRFSNKKKKLKKELQRSKTLPVIDVSHILPVTSSNSLKVTDNTTIRKYSAPGEITETCSRDDSNSSEHSGRSRERDHRKLQLRSESVDRRKSLKRGGSARSRSSAWNFDDDTDSTASSETVTTGSDDPSTSRTPQLYYTTPPRANMVKGADHERRLESSGSFYKLARRLSQKDRKDADSHSRQRSVSLDCGDGRTIRIFTADDLTMDGMPALTASPSAPAFLSKGGAPSPSPNRQPRSLVVTPRKKGSSGDLESLSPAKMERRRSEKDRRSCYDIHALFDAVEQQDIDVVRTILDSGGVELNSVNSEGLTPLDVAVMTNNIPMAKMLLFHGARESPIFQQGDCRLDKLEALIAEAEKKVVDFTAAVLNSSSGNANISPAQQKENETQLSHWEFRYRLLKRMRAGYDHARPPDAPTNVRLSVASSSSLLVNFGEPLNHNGAVVTKYRVEWSNTENFTSIAGEVTVEDVRQLEFEIQGLVKGSQYYVRVSACNMKGCGTSTLSNPPCAVPSNWRDVDSVSPRLDGKVQSLQILFHQVKQSRPSDASELKDSRHRSTDSPQQRKRISIKNLFISAPKFQKSLKRGVYMACLLYNEDRVLVTSEEQLPIIEVDENFSGPSIQSDLYWMMKIACTWDDVKSLRHDMDKSNSAGTVHFRSKLLQAASTLQSSLGIHDLGQFYHKPLKDPNGSIVLVTMNHVRETKFVALGSGKWVSLGKLTRRQSLAGMDINDANSLLLSSVPDMILYHQVSSIPLPRGLYLGYLKIHVSVEKLQVLVQHKMPNVLPHVKVRDCPNVSREEWEYLQSLGSNESVMKPSSTQQEFRTTISKASRRLLSMLGISPDVDHRVYDFEVIELSPQVSFIIVLPPAEEVCIVPGQTDDLTDKKDLSFLPVQVFEMINYYTYHPEFISRYSRLSSIIEMDVNLAQQAHREAFSSDELSTARVRVDVMVQLQQTLDKIWKSVRWVMDIITYARDKTTRGGIPLAAISQYCDDNDTPEPERRSRIPDNNNSSSAFSCDSNEISVGKDNRKIAKFYDPNDDVPGQSSESEAGSSSHVPSSGVLRVYAAYETGLSKGVSVKLHVTTKTSARDVINLVVRQLNKAVITRGIDGPLYTEDQLSDFCLVAVIGARERVLRDDYVPLQLQNPWTKGRLYVRLRNNVLAAIQQGHATAV
ncbi:ankyrin repeat and fibronectin type-III domain-containing protein 1-like isoform X2 [Haliotis asinina]|uniref:ankyrin repeat and fibronectin type-III domain-containing protein 1-like isoform X2 n=1 Tax=Haliotis asinina TaxID=109174 RepID=UPI003531D3CF